MDFVISDQLITLIAWMILAAFIALLVVGMTNRVVIFADSKDLMWTVSIFLAPVIGLMVAGSLIVCQECKEFVPSDEPLATGVGIVFVAFALFASVKTFMTAIKHNGALIGIIVGIFKVFAAILAAICTLGFIGKILDEHGTFASKIISVVLFGALLWTIRKLINGDEFYAQRAQMSETSN
jgi:hypothetical protein